MQKNSPAFSPEEVLQLAKSPAGQQLLAMLRQADQNQLAQIQAQVNRGDLAEAGRSLQKLLSSPEAKALLDSIRR